MHMQINECTQQLQTYWRIVKKYNWFNTKLCSYSSLSVYVSCINGISMEVYMYGMLDIGYLMYSWYQTTLMDLKWNI